MGDWNISCRPTFSTGCIFKDQSDMHIHSVFSHGVHSHLHGITLGAGCMCLSSTLVVSM